MPVRRRIALVPRLVVGGVLAALLALNATTAPTPAAAAEADDRIPVSLVEYGGAHQPTIEITVEDSAPLRVLVDTGSSGLVVPDHLVDVTSLDDLHSPYTQNYLSGPVPGAFYSGRIELGAGTPAATSMEAPLLVAECATLPCSWLPEHVHGILGVGQGLQEFVSDEAPFEHHRFAAPFTVLSAPLGAGVTLSLGAPGEAGWLSLGKPAAIPGSTALSATRASGEYQNHLPVYDHWVSACWIISGITACDAFTTFDTGDTSGLIETTQFEALFGRSSHPLPDGTTVRFSAGSGSAPFAGMTVGAGWRPWNEPEHPETPLRNNSGSAFFLNRTVAIDFELGQVIVGPSAGVPDAAPGGLRAADVTATSFALSWTPADSMSGLPLTGYRVIVADAAGALVRQLDLPAEALGAALTGLTPDTSYRVTTTALGANGAGPPSAPLAVETTLGASLASSGAPENALGPLGIAVVTLGLLLLRLARKPPARRHRGA